MRNQSPGFANVVLDSLTAHIAVLDADGVIVGVNEPWRRFAQENAGDNRNCYIGSNYLQVCETAAQRDGDETAATIAEGLRAVLRHEREVFTLEYPCSSPAEDRWYTVRITHCLQDGQSRAVVAHEDISARKRAEMALERNERTLRMILDALPVGVWLMDQSGRIVQGNASGQRIWAGARYVDPADFGEYQGWWLHNGEPIAASEWAAARAISKGETSIDEEILIRCFDGSQKIILNSAIPLREADGRISGAIIVNQDITARHTADEELRHAKRALEQINRELQQTVAREHEAARTDELTGLHNRRHFFDLGTQQFDIARRYGKSLTIAMFDLDHFKAVNDSYGHQLGDRALQHVARLAGAHLRAADVLARYGGEEFVLLMPETDATPAMALAERIRTAVQTQPMPSERGPIALSVSLGIARLQADDDNIETLIQRADRALYAAKAAGRNCCMMV